MPAGSLNRNISKEKSVKSLALMILMLNTFLLILMLLI